MSFEGFGVAGGPTPTHVGFIADGTRRWAARTGISLTDAYPAMAVRRAEFTSFLLKSGVSVVTNYCMSVRNFDRSPDQVDAIFRGEQLLIAELLPPIAADLKSTVRIVGRRDLFPPRFAEACRELERASRSRASRCVYLLVGYDPWYELRDAPNRPTRVEDLLVPLDVDLLVRFGGEHRLSGFLPLQSAQAELMFDSRTLMEVKADEFPALLAGYEGRERRLGG